MGADEKDTHEGLQAHFRELVNSNINGQWGRIVENTGDGPLAKFQSEFRIGVNLGDVIVEEHNIFGDGVNVVARL